MYAWSPPVMDDYYVGDLMTKMTESGQRERSPDHENLMKRRMKTRERVRRHREKQKLEKRKSAVS